MRHALADYIRAGFAGLYLVTHEEIRAEAELKAVAAELGYTLFSWSITTGLLNTDTGTVREVFDPVEAVNALADVAENSILLLKDFHQFLGDLMQPASPLVTRTLKERIREARCNAKVLAILGCRTALPAELEKDFTVVEFDLPDRDTLRAMAANIARSAGIEPEDELLDHAAESARGLTVVEAEDIMALTVVRGEPLDARMIAQEKAKAIKKDGLLEVIEAKETAADIGGLDNLKAWLHKRRNAFSQEAEAFGLPTPKGVLILGIPGTGKSLTAKAAASILQRPILKLDAGKLFAGIVGESEANLRRAIQTAEAICPCILWLEELEKSFSGSRSSGSTDGGTSARVFGSFISWLQEKTSPVFVVATANDVSQLPPELLRKGRIDEIFFADLPGEDEREAIWRIHIAKRKRDPGAFDVTALMKLSDGFTGSEIEQAVIDALYDSFDAGQELSTQAIVEAVQRTVPLSVTMSEQINAMRQWAKNRARSASGDPAELSTTRRIAA